jgi:hypothetical protein
MLLAASSTTYAQRYCLMPEPPASAREQSAHDCCASGIGAVPPACCHSDLSMGPKAILAGKSLAVVLASTPATTWSRSVSRQETPRVGPQSFLRPHEKPPTILRL